MRHAHDMQRVHKVRQVFVNQQPLFLFSVSHLKNQLWVDCRIIIIAAHLVGKVICRTSCVFQYEFPC